MHATTFIILLLRTQSPNFKSRENHHFKFFLKKSESKNCQFLPFQNPGGTNGFGESTRKEPTIILFYFS
jgi:hypothetical protein